MLLTLRALRDELLFVLLESYFERQRGIHTHLVIIPESYYLR